MKLKVFSIAAVGDELAEECLNHFLASHRVAQIDRELVNSGSGSYWSVCVGYWDLTTVPEVRSKKARIDYRQILSETQFREYAALREWRKNTAESEGVPVYAIFSNEQMASIVQLESAEPAAVSAIDGIGKSKLEQYVSPALAALASHRIHTS